MHLFTMLQPPFSRRIVGIAMRRVSWLVWFWARYNLALRVGQDCILPTRLTVAGQRRDFRLRGAPDFPRSAQPFGQGHLTVGTYDILQVQFSMQSDYSTKTSDAQLRAL